VPPYGENELVKSPKAVAAGTEGSQGIPGTRDPLNSDPPAAPPLNIILLDHDMTQDAQGPLQQPTAQVTGISHTDGLQRTGDTDNVLGTTSIIVIESTDEWQKDALTTTEEAYILKYYAKRSCSSS
jgi:hypothetical protein